MFFFSRQEKEVSWGTWIFNSAYYPLISTYYSLSHKRGCLKQFPKIV